MAQRENFRGARENIPFSSGHKLRVLAERVN